MNSRKLRIAWSVFWGVAAVLIIVLWVRSYGKWDTLSYYTDPYNQNTTPLQADLESWRGVCSLYAEPSGEFEELPFFQRWTHSVKTPPVWLPQPHWKFQIGTEHYRHEYRAPHWFFVVLASACAPIPWIIWQPGRFSLRTLLIATTLVAFVLGLIAWTNR